MKTIESENGTTAFVGKRFRCTHDGTVHQIEQVHEVHNVKFFGTYAVGFVGCPKCKRATEIVVDLPDPDDDREEWCSCKDLY